MIALIVLKKNEILNFHFLNEQKPLSEVMSGLEMMVADSRLSQTRQPMRQEPQSFRSLDGLIFYRLAPPPMVQVVW